MNYTEAKEQGISIAKEFEVSGKFPEDDWIVLDSEWQINLWSGDAKQHNASLHEVDEKGRIEYNGTHIWNNMD